MSHVNLPERKAQFYFRYCFYLIRSIQYKYEWYICLSSLSQSLTFCGRHKSSRIEHLHPSISYRTMFLYPKATVTALSLEKGDIFFLLQMPEFALPTILLMFWLTGERFILVCQRNALHAAYMWVLFTDELKLFQCKMTLYELTEKFSITTHHVVNDESLKISFQKSQFYLTEDALDKPTAIWDGSVWWDFLGGATTRYHDPYQVQTQMNIPILWCLRGMPVMLVSLRCTEDHDQLSPCGAPPLSALEPMHAFDGFCLYQSLLGWF